MPGLCLMACAIASASDGPQKASTPSKKCSPNEPWRREINRQRWRVAVLRESKCQLQGCQRQASEQQRPSALPPPCRSCDRPTMQSSLKIRQMTVFEIAWYCISTTYGRAPQCPPCLVSQPSEWIDPSIDCTTTTRSQTEDARPRADKGSVQAAGCVDRLATRN